MGATFCPCQLDLLYVHIWRNSFIIHLASSSIYNSFIHAHYDELTLPGTAVKPVESMGSQDYGEEGGGSADETTVQSELQGKLIELVVCRQSNAC